MKRLLAIFLFLAAFSTPAFSIEPVEREALKEILATLGATGALIEEAQYSSSKTERFKFEYVDLASDLLIIKQGITAAIHGNEKQNFTPRALIVEYGYSGNAEESRYLNMLKIELSALKVQCDFLAKQYSDSTKSRIIDYGFLASDLSKIIDGITVSVSGSGDVPRRFERLRGSHS